MILLSGVVESYFDVVGLEKWRDSIMGNIRVAGRPGRRRGVKGQHKEGGSRSALSNM